MPAATVKPTLRRLPRNADPEEIMKIARQDGGLIIENFLTSDQLRAFNNELDPALEKLKPGSTHADKWTADFHGSNTKRLTNVVTHSKTFREQLLDDDFVHTLCEKVFREESGTYWMTSAQVIEIGPDSPAQPLHRDLENQYPFVTMGPSGPEVSLNFLIGLTEFTNENGATRVIPGSHLWPDFSDRGKQDMTIPAEIKAGDAILVPGKLVHGGGANRTTDQYRRAVAFTFQPGFLTPEEAYPFMVDMKLATQMSPRAQQMLGFRSQYPKGSPGLWQNDYKELGAFLGLDG